ncbi:hypothetical protein [Streptosporangium longisporum]|uniref:DUF1963 domain-containing protein n=1 Tax=Streptosporangium longisporum TaxID=46187 RepID=A0ABP6LBG4_9ACTN
MTHFVYRTHYEGPLGKRVRRLPDATVLDWFRRGWRTVVDDPAGDARAWVAAELGGDVYGLSTIFEDAREHRLPAPRSWRDLADMLPEHLYHEGDLLVDEHSVRVHTDDDEVELPYFFFDDTLAARHPERVAYLLHDGWPLPDDTREGGGTGAGTTRDPDAGPDADAPHGPDAVATHAVLLTFYDSESICWQPPFSFPGVRLPALAAHLRATAEDLTEWPHELLVLRALVAPGDDDLGPALRRCNHWPSYDGELPPELLGEHAPAHAFALGRLEESASGGDLGGGRDPSRTLLECGAHLAQMSIHLDGHFGHQQWFVFDDVWAGRHGDLAASLLRYATDWDPFGPEED